MSLSDGFSRLAITTHGLHLDPGMFKRVKAPGFSHPGEVVDQSPEAKGESLIVIGRPRVSPQFLGSDYQLSLPEAKEASTWQAGTCHGMGLLLIIFPVWTFPKEMGKGACGSAPSPSPALFGRDNEPFTHSQLQVLLVTLPICCHGCLVQQQLGELIHDPLYRSSESLWIVLSAHCMARFTHRPGGRSRELALPVPGEVLSRRCQPGTLCLFSNSL